MSKKQSCIICSAIPQNILVLACNHSLCLSCSAQRIQNNLDTSQHVINCKLCNQSTFLTLELYQELACQLQKTQIQKPLKYIQNSQSTRYRKQPTYSVSNNCNLQNMCSYHPDYVTIYVCKTCSNTIICPQCVINGSHKHHNVNTVQKEGQSILNQLKNCLSKFTKKIDDLNLINSNKIEEINQNILSLKNLQFNAKSQYKRIKEIIDQEQILMLKKIQDSLNLYKQEMAYFQDSIKTQLSILQCQKQNILNLINPFSQQIDSQAINCYKKANFINFIKQYRLNRISHQLQIFKNAILQEQIQKKRPSNNLKLRQNIERQNYYQENTNQMLNSVSFSHQCSQKYRQIKSQNNIKPKSTVFRLI